jgi:four helix bundle protein
MCNEKQEYTLGRQVLKSGTSIGANVSEAIEGQSKKDFISKLSVSLKEASETRYWLKLLVETDILLEEEANSLLLDLEEIIKLLNTVIKTTKQNL